MPDLASLEQFNNFLTTVGNEGTVAKKRGEVIEAVSPPSPDEFLVASPNKGDAGKDATATSRAEDFFAGISGADTGDETDGSTEDDNFFNSLGLDDPPPALAGDADFDLGLGADPAADPAGDADFDLGLGADPAVDPAGDADFDLGLGADLATDLATDPAGDADFDLGLGADLATDLAGDADFDLGLGADLATDPATDPAGDADFDLGLGADPVTDLAGDATEDIAVGDDAFSIADSDNVSDGGKLVAENLEDTSAKAGPFGDEFSLDDLGEEFVLSEEDFQVGDHTLLVNDDPLLVADGDDSDAYTINDNEFTTLQVILNAFPLNLRITIAEVVLSNKYPFEAVQKLITALTTQKSAHECAQLVSRITGKHIKVPRSYEKLRGIEFDKEQQSFAYKFKETIWPTLRFVLAGTALLTTLIFVGYRYMYQPLLARSIYVRGLENIALQEYEQANRLFDQAYQIWPVSIRFLDYANAFRTARQFALAKEKYVTLLGDEVDPLNKKAILEFSNFSTYDLRDYETSLEYLERLIMENVWDYEALLSKGDTYLEWGIQFDTPEDRDALFEQARFTYASLIQEYGQEDELLFRMLRYFILTQKVEDALDLKDLFLSDKRAVLDPYGMTDLAGFLLDLSEDGRYAPAGDSDAVSQYIAGLQGSENSFRFLDDAQLVLDKAMRLNDEIPEIHYYLARYSRQIDDLQVEIIALKNARELYDEVSRQRPLNRFEVSREIDTYIREGEVLYRLGEVLNAETRYRQAVGLYEQAIVARQLSPEPKFGRVYANLGDIYYQQAIDYDAAESFYLQARENKYGSLTEYTELFQERRDLAYKLGFINFFKASGLNIVNRIGEKEQQDLLDRAITEFNQSQGAIPTANLNLLYARANTQYLRQNYFDAAGLYRILLDELTTERASISTFLLEEDDQHKALIDYQIRVNNNLGVTLYRIYQQGGENANDFFAQSQLFLSRSTELSENLVRDAETAVRANTKPLAYLNLTRILAPEFVGDIQIDPDIRKDLAAVTF